MKKRIIELSLILLVGSLYGQVDSRIARTKTPLSDVELVALPLQDNAQLIAEELARRAPGVAPRFAVAVPVDIRPATHGTWEYLPGDQAVWRLRIRSVGARSLNLGFTRYQMPAGGSLVVYDPAGARVLGPFTPADNEEHEQLWTPVFPGEELVLEVVVPKTALRGLQLELKFVHHDFLGFGEVLSGSCNLDVICGEADGWALVDAYRDIIQSVAVIGLNGGTFCTGFLVNNTRQDCTPFFMTAQHCGINGNNAASLVAYWNFQQSTCRQPGTPASGGAGDGLLNDFNTGAFFRSGWSNSDFTLVELDDPVSQTADAYFAGWDIGGSVPADTVICIHHPSTDEKRISFEFDTASVSDINGNPSPAGNFIKVPDWDVGTTEGGSSGSPLFNRQRQVIGQLYGGLAACSNNEYDVFGWIHRSWTGGGTPSTRLRDWLDPDDTGLTALEGRSAMACQYSLAVNPVQQVLCSPDSVWVTVGVSENFEGPVVLSAAGVPAFLTAMFGSDTLSPGGGTNLLLAASGAWPAGHYELEVTATDGIHTTTATLAIAAEQGVPPSPQAVFPPDGGTGVGLLPLLGWQSLPAATYSLEIATDTAFADIIESVSVWADSSYQVQGSLSVNTEYFWRVQAANSCGESGWSVPLRFRTGVISCGAGAAEEGLPAAISPSGTPSVVSTLEVSSPGTVQSVRIVDLEINHTWVGDLRVELVSPAGTTITLLANPGAGGCGNDNMLVTLDDAADNPYAALDAMCNGGGLAIGGSFQPMMPLQSFGGEPAAGTWTLRVYDDANQDGGTLVGWSMEWCAVVPDEAVLILSEAAGTACRQDTLAIGIIGGTGFDDSTGIFFYASNLPAGAVAHFEPNPAQPGEQVVATFYGSLESGTFPLDIQGADGMGNEVSVPFTWQVADVPSAPLPTLPLSGAVDIPPAAVLGWDGSPGAIYMLVVATDSAMQDTIVTHTTDSQQFTLSGLSYCTTYHWSVTAIGECGQSLPSVIQTFTTEEDLGFETEPFSLYLCATGTATAVLELGVCWDSSGVLLGTGVLPEGLSISFDENPSLPGTSVVLDIEASGVGNTDPIQVQLTGSGLNLPQQGLATLTLAFGQPAAATQLLLPVDEAQDIDPLTVEFSWQPVPAAAGYVFELALDDGFQVMVHQVTTAGTEYGLPLVLEGEAVYYWRVTAYNDCGGTTGGYHQFGTGPLVRTEDRPSSYRVDLDPNPTGGTAWLKRTGMMPAVNVQVWTLAGRLLYESTWRESEPIHRLDFSGYGNGNYLVKLISGHAVVTKRMVVFR
jgi:subtilisin-like proprotein convertase family protein